MSPLAILLVVIAANFPTQTNSKPAELPPSQSTAVATKGQNRHRPNSSQPAAPQISSGADKRSESLRAINALSGRYHNEAAKPAPMHDHAMVKAEAVAPPAPVQSSAKPDKEPQKAVADAAGLQGDAVAGRQVFKKCQACHSLEPGKDHPGSKPGRDRRPQVGRRTEFQLFAGDEAGRIDVGCGHTRRLFDGSPEDRAGQPNAVSRPEDRSGPQGRDRVSGSSRFSRLARRPLRKPLRRPLPRRQRRKPNQAAMRPISRTRSTHCAPELRKEKWSFWALAARSTARQTRF